jgi:hypothetical protein
MDGANSNAHESIVQEIFNSTGELVMIAQDMIYGDGSSELSNKKVGSAVSTTSSDWNITVDNTNNEIVVTNANELSFGQTDVGEIVGVVATPGGDKFVTFEEPSSPNLTGEIYKFNVGELTYTISQ